MGAYRIPDEPLPGALSRLAVNPLWPLLGLMVGGPWAAWPWFLLNGHALGSPTRLREGLAVLLGLLGTVALVSTILTLDRRGVFTTTTAQLALLLVTLWKIAISYYLYLTQSRSFGLYEYYGGPVRNGALVVIAVALAEPKLLAPVKNLFVLLVLG